MPMHKRGGRVSAKNSKYIEGESSKRNVKEWGGYAKKGSKEAKRATGGRVHMTAGALTGEGRLQEIKAYGKNARRQDG